MSLLIYFSSLQTKLDEHTKVYQMQTTIDGLGLLTNCNIQIKIFELLKKLYGAAEEIFVFIWTDLSIVNIVIIMVVILILLCWRYKYN